jgi:cell division transport system ATP-binding protein
VIEFERVSKRYESGQDALRELSFRVEPEELVFLTGHSGAGKSTLLKLIMLLERPTRGRIVVNGRDLSTIQGAAIAHHRREIGVVFQDHQLLYDRSVFDNVALPLIVSGFDARDIGRRVRAALDKVGLLEKERANPESLSGGEQQRVGIARAVATRPKIILADEPTGNLDPALSNDIMALFRAFSRAGVTVLIATHDLPMISRMQHRIFTLQDGRHMGTGHHD